MSEAAPRLLRLAGPEPRPSAGGVAPCDAPPDAGGAWRTHVQPTSRTREPAVGATLQRNFSWAFLGNAVSQLSNWLTIVIVAKLFEPELAGRYAFALAVCAPVFMFSNLQLRTVQATDARDQYSFGEFFTVRLTTSLLALGALFIAAFASDALGTARLLILLVAVLRSVDSVADIIYGLLQKHERLDRVSLSLIFKGPLGLAGMLGLTLLSGGSLPIGVLGLLAASLVVLLVYDARNARRLLAGREPQQVRLAPAARRQLLNLLVLTLPLGFATLLSSLAGNIPRYFLRAWTGERGLGFFAALVYLVTAGNALVGSLNQAAYPSLARRFHTDRVAFRALLTRMLAIAAGIGLLGLLVAVAGGRQILTILYRPEYAEHANVFVWLMAAGVLDYTATACLSVMIVARLFRLQLLILAACALTILTACLLLVPGHGLVGAAWALIAGETVRLSGALLAARHALRTRGATASGSPQTA